jgi:hypothetical protein
MLRFVAVPSNDVDLCIGTVQVTVIYNVSIYVDAVEKPAETRLVSD